MAIAATRAPARFATRSQPVFSKSPIRVSDTKRVVMNSTVSFKAPKPIPAATQSPSTPTLGRGGAPSGERRVPRTRCQQSQVVIPKPYAWTT